MAVIVYYVHDDKEFDPSKDFFVFANLNWEDSSNEVLMFKDGLKYINNEFKSKKGTFYQPNCLLFNVVVLDIEVSNFSVRSIGFSILPLDIPEMTSVQGYFQLPVYKHPFSKDIIDMIKPLESWGLCQGMNKNKQNIKVMNCSIFVRVHLANFEVALTLPGMARKSFKFRHDERHDHARLPASQQSRGHQGAVPADRQDVKAPEESIRHRRLRSGRSL